MEKSGLISCLATLFFLTTAAPAQVPLSAFVNFEGAQTNPIRMSADGTRLFALNTPDNRVSVFNLSNPASPALIVEIPVGIEPVSVNVNPSNIDEAWVVNQESDSVSVISVSRGIVTDTIYCKDEPSDVVFAGANAFVSVSRSNAINVYSIATHALVKSIPVLGGNPRALAVGLSGTLVYAAFALAGNATTILPSYIAPPQPPPTNPKLPAAPQTGLVIAANDPTWSWYIKYQMPNNGVVAIDTAKLSVRHYYSGVGSENLGIAVRPGTGDLFVSNTNALNLIRFEPNLLGHWNDNQVTSIQISSGLVSPYNLNPTINYTVLPNPAALATALAQPMGEAFDPSGKFLWVAAFGTDRVAKVSSSGAVLSFIEIGPAVGSQINPVTKKGPLGLALNAAAKTLYVLNRISNTISVVNTATNAVAAEIATGTFDPTPTAILGGRGYLYDAKLSGNGTGACSSCHLNADMDMLAWDLGNPAGAMQTVVNNGNTFRMHPMKGPMATRSLRGLNGVAPLHWRGDMAAFTNFNTVFSDLMGGSQLSDSEMAAYQAFLFTVVFQPNPNENMDRTYPVSMNGGNAVNGQSDFLNALIGNLQNSTCNSCHATNPGIGSNETILSRTNLAQPLKVPALRNVYQKLGFSNAPGSQSIGGFGLSSDGAMSTFAQVFAQPVLGGFTGDPQAQLDVAAFVSSFDTGMAPAVGYARTVTAANVTLDPTIASDWALLQSQAAAANIDLIIKGTLNGALHGFVYLPASNTYEADSVSIAPYTQAQLISQIAAGDTMSVMGVPVGSGVRMGIDRNLDGILDGDE